MTITRFEIVHTGPHKFHTRFVAANNETVWVTESYRRRDAAFAAIASITNAPIGRGPSGHRVASLNGWRVEVREIDERP